MQRILLPRTGQADAPLAFNGTLGRELEARPDGMDDRWYVLRAYTIDEADVPTLAIGIGYRSTRRRERSLDWAWWGPLDSRRILARSISSFAIDHRIDDCLLGIPQGEQFDPKRQEIEDALRVALMIGVGELMEASGMVEEL